MSGITVGISRAVVLMGSTMLGVGIRDARDVRV